MTTVDQQAASVEQVLGQMRHMVVSKKSVNFLILPAEIRNSIYEFLEFDNLPTALAFFNSCRQLRQEYRSIYLQKASIKLPFSVLRRFLDTFFPADTKEVMARYECQFIVDIAHGYDAPKAEYKIDLKWLIALLHQSPKLSISFEGDNSFKWEAEDLNQFVNIVRDNKTWRDRLADFHSITMPTHQFLWHRGLMDEGRYIRRPTWELELFLKPEAVETWWGDDTTDRDTPIAKLLFELGLYKIRYANVLTKIFGGLKIGVYKKGIEKDEMSSLRDW
ncbi:hypothetical protein N0V83_002770 [Neocucurbitaria cava]|uniref:F-box domain-containing protein n=1 Tax=Neocucurbitaria cava TaxID=798079 RepID=A0A9W8YDD8_9PLEO|nr:hypothetical protein N0V83_002770 [Neocucurbitaria cava]